MSVKRLVAPRGIMAVKRMIFLFRILFTLKKACSRRFVIEIILSYMPPFVNRKNVKVM